MGARGEVGGEVAGVDIGDGRHERRPQQRHHAPHLPARAQVPELAGPVPALQRGLERTVPGVRGRAARLAASAPRPPGCAG